MASNVLVAEKEIYEECYRAVITKLAGEGLLDFANDIDHQDDRRDVC